MDKQAGILVVDDEKAIADLLSEALSSISQDIEVVNSGTAAVEACARRSFDLVISDMWMPEMDGAQLLSILAHDYPSMRRVILTGRAEIDNTLSAINQGRVHRYLTKPIEMSELLKTVQEELRIGEKERAELLRLRKMINQLADD